MLSKTSKMLGSWAHSKCSEKGGGGSGGYSGWRGCCFNRLVGHLRGFVGVRQELQINFLYIHY